jgi:hypothetical protein
MRNQASGMETRLGSIGDAAGWWWECAVAMVWWRQLTRKRAKRASIVSQKARHIARLVQVLRRAKSARLRMTIKFCRVKV